jgi:S1-C subfamily serine protease
MSTSSGDVMMAQEDKTVTTSTIWKQLSDELATIAADVGRRTVSVRGQRRGAIATGILWSGDTVITVDHPLTGSTGAVVSFAPERHTDAEIVGRDPATDLAVLRLAERQDEGPAASAEASGRLSERTLRIGEMVMALGRSRRGNLVASAGIVSGLMGEWRGARGGLIDAFIRPDLALYSGMSGGPLVDHLGHIVGMTTSALRPGSPVAIPATMLERLSQELIKRGRVARPYLGVSMQPTVLPESIRTSQKIAEREAALVVHVEEGGPADRAGLTIGDLLVKIGSEPVEGVRDVRALLGRLKPGEPVGLVVVRGGALKTLELTVGEKGQRK